MSVHDEKADRARRLFVPVPLNPCELTPDPDYGLDGHMTDTRYSAEELRKMAEPYAKLADDFRVNPMLPETVEYLDKTASVFRQAARDAETLAGIRAFILKYSHPDEFDRHAIAYGQAVLAHMDKLMAKGDA